MRTVSALTSTTSGMIERKKTITLGLPRVSDSEPRNARQPREAAGGGAPTTVGAVAILHARVEEIGGAGEFDGDKDAGEGLGDHRKARGGQHEPDHVADEIAGDERRNALKTLAEHPRHQRRHARPRRGDRGEIDAGENKE